MKNPFEYGGVIGPNNFCSRTVEMEAMVEDVSLGQSMTVFSGPRTGKSSLIHYLFSRLPRKKYLPIIIELRHTFSDASFITALLKGFLEGAATTSKQLQEWADVHFKALLPEITTGTSPVGRIDFKLNEPQLSQEIPQALKALVQLTATLTKIPVIALDDFDHVCDYPDSNLPRIIKHLLKSDEKMVFIFSGRRKSVIESDYFSGATPVFKGLFSVPFDLITEKEWTPFIHRRFSGSNKIITQDIIHSICQLTEGHPYLTQHCCHILWDHCHENTRVTKDHLRKAFRILMARESGIYSAIWEQITANQRRVLTGIAKESSKARLFSGEFCRKYGVVSPASVQRAVKSLLDSDLVCKGGDGFYIPDRFFKLWIRR